MKHSSPGFGVRGLEDRAPSELRDPGLAYVWTVMEQWTDCEERAAILGEPNLCEARCFCPHAASPKARRAALDAAASRGGDPDHDLPPGTSTG
jgi:hypothetical protein